MQLQFSSKGACIMLLLCAIVGELVFIGFNERENIAQHMWERYHRFPNVVLFLYPDADMARRIGKHYLSLGTYDPDAYDRSKAEKYYEYSLQKDPNQPQVVYRMGMIDFVDGNFGSAHIHLTDVIEDDKVDKWLAGRARYMRGLLYGYNEQFARSETDFKHLLQTFQDETSWAVYVDLSWVYFQQGKYKEIEELALRGLKFYPDNPWLLSTYGTALLNNGKEERATEVLARARKESRKVTPQKWALAYPANDPAGAQGGLEKMQAIIEKNLQLASGGVELVE